MTKKCEDGSKRQLAPGLVTDYQDCMKVFLHSLVAIASATVWLSLMPFSIGAAHASSERGAAPVLIELFTSQGCYSCPPADKLLGELAAKENVVALAYHVTYWDRLGWPDPFGTKWGTQRQYHYGRQISQGRVYTPQLVVNGQTHVVGSNRLSVRSAIDVAARSPNPATPQLRWLKDRRLQVTTPNAPAAAGAKITLIRFDKERETEILRGENGGKRLTYHQIVRERQALGRFNGQARTIQVAIQSDDPIEWGVAVIVQEADGGQVFGAAILSAPKPDA